MEHSRGLNNCRNEYHVPRERRLCCLGVISTRSLLGLSTRLDEMAEHNALYPVLFPDYMKSAIPELEDGFPRITAVLALTAVLTYINYRGLTIVGWAAILLGVFSLLPFVLMGFLTIPELEPSRWFVVDLRNVDGGLYLNVLFWNLNYWDLIITLSGEVENPDKTLPKALFYAFILVVFAYFFPLLIGTGAMSVPLDRGMWSDGYYAVIAKILGAVWLRSWIQGASAFSNMSMFVAEMSSDSFKLLGMAERGMLPEFFAKRSPYGTPLTGILFSASGVLLLSWLSFQEIVAAESFLYCFAMIMGFIAFVKSRLQNPDFTRPYKVPLGTAGEILLCIPPTLLYFGSVSAGSSQSHGHQHGRSGYRNNHAAVCSVCREEEVVQLLKKYQPAKHEFRM